MSNDARVRYADDWRIVRKELVSVGAILGVGLEAYYFKSPSLHYRATFYVPKGSIGASIGANFSSAVTTALGQANTQLGNVENLRGGNDTWRILRRFPLNDLVGGSVKIGSVGAAVGPVEGNGATLKISDNNGVDVATYEGGSFGAGAGAQINLGTAAIGLFLGPYDEN